MAGQKAGLIGRLAVSNSRNVSSFGKFSRPKAVFENRKRRILLKTGFGFEIYVKQAGTVGKLNGGGRYRESCSVVTRYLFRNRHPHSPLKPSFYCQLTGEAMSNKSGNRRKRTRVAVLGLYSSGSSATAGVLHHLGVGMGKRFYRAFYEEQRLARFVRAWWSEPALEASNSRATRITQLRNWVRQMENGGVDCIGGKHPLLLMSAEELVEAWGDQTKLIWAWRPLRESIASLQRRAWWPGEEERIQTRLWESANHFFNGRSHCKVNYSELINSPGRQVQRLIDFLGICPTANQINNAIQSVQRPG